LISRASLFGFSGQIVSGPDLKRSSGNASWQTPYLGQRSTSVRPTRPSEQVAGGNTARIDYWSTAQSDAWLELITGLSSSLSKRAICRSPASWCS